MATTTIPDDTAYDELCRFLGKAPSESLLDAARRVTSSRTARTANRRHLVGETLLRESGWDAIRQAHKAMRTGLVVVR